MHPYKGCVLPLDDSGIESPRQESNLRTLRVNTFVGSDLSGPGGTRTPCLLRAKQALSLMSYRPLSFLVVQIGIEPMTSRVSGAHSSV